MKDTMNNDEDVNSKVVSSNDAKTANLSIRQVTSVRSGPLPTPKEFAEYEKVCPGAADRIISLTERQSKHRQEIEMIEVKTAARDSLLGLVFAFVFCMTSICGAIYLISNNHTITGTILGGVGLTTVVTAFIQGKTQTK